MGGVLFVETGEAERARRQRACFAMPGNPTLSWAGRQFNIIVVKTRSQSPNPDAVSSIGFFFSL